MTSPNSPSDNLLPLPPSADGTCRLPTTLEWRVRLLMLLVCGFWLLLAGRLVQLQWFSRHRFSDQVEQQSTFLEEIPARPGDIFDRDGRVLAMTIASKSFFVVPSQITQHPEQRELVRRLAEAVGQETDALQARIALHHEKHFLWVRRRIVDPDVVARLNELKLPRDVGGFREEFLRQYPQGHLAAHVLGGRDIDGVGRGGIEQHLNERLAGRSGYRRLVLDSRRRVIDMQTDIAQAPQHGQSVTLSLDTIIQLHTEEELDKLMEKWGAKHAAAIVLDPKTGEVLAMASRPTYDPNDLTHVSEEAWKNQALAAIYEPGSTFKPFIVSWAIEQGLIRRDESFDCERGEYRMGSRVLHDHHKYGMLNVTDVLVKSSNIGMAKIGQRLGNAELYQAALVFGFGRPTGIELPGELPGMLAPLKKWTSYSTGSIPMGQEIAVTPLQLITAHAALANGGQLISPRLVRADRTVPTAHSWVEKPDGNRRAADMKPGL
ncbi:MAG TPA: penicillin-binding protein 2, partial [Planctomycetaceae bacterium]|nr:penicillin-binding protein 2 [Planctomycetaceae bacterium]